MHVKIPIHKHDVRTEPRFYPSGRPGNGSKERHALQGSLTALTICSNDLGSLRHVSRHSNSSSEIIGSRSGGVRSIISFVSPCGILLMSARSVLIDFASFAIRFKIRSRRTVLCERLDGLSIVFKLTQHLKYLCLLNDILAEVGC